MQDLIQVAVPIVIVHVVVLVLLLLGIRFLLQATANKAVVRVKAVEDEVRKKEEDIRREIDDHERDFAEKKAEAERQLQAHRDEAKREALHLKEKAVAEAKKESQKIIEQAKRNEEKIREQVEREMEEKAVKYGGRIFELVFSDLVTQEVNTLFCKELIDALGEIETGTITVETPVAEIAVSHELAEENRDRLLKILKEKFHPEAELKQSVDEKLMAGLILKMGSLEIDGSLKNRYQEATGELYKEVEHAH